MAYSAALKKALGPLRHVVLPVEAQQVEHVLRLARVALAAGSLVEIRLVVGVPGTELRLAMLLAAAYLAFGLALVLWGRSRVSVPSTVGVHGVDILWAALLPVVTGNPHVPFSVFLLFTLLSAAYRWGFWSTLATVGSMISLLLLESGLPTLVASGPGFGSATEDLPARAIGWVLMGSLVGFLGESQRVLRERMLAASRLLAIADGHEQTQRTLEDLVREMLALFRAREAAVVLEDQSTARTFLWQATRERRSGEVSFASSELNSMERGRYLFPAPGDAWCVVQRRLGEGPPVRLVVLDEQGQRQPPYRGGADLPFLEGCRSYYAAALPGGGQKSGRLILFDPIGGGDREAELRLVQSLVREMALAAHCVASRQGARRELDEDVVRGRLARELHDGVIQTLAAAEMRMEALRRKGIVAQGAAEELEGIQRLLHHEAVEMRELVHGLRSRTLAPGELVNSLLTIVEAFRQETGIFATFASHCEEVKLPPQVCREVVQIVREALVNVRKHSGAQKVEVCLTQQNGHCKLLIDDNGRGFDFAGQHSLDELETSGQGPWVIKERVRLIRGDLTVESKPGRGCRLEITVPQRIYE